VHGFVHGHIHYSMHRLNMHIYIIACTGLCMDRLNMHIYIIACTIGNYVFYKVSYHYSMHRLICIYIHIYIIACIG